MARQFNLCFVLRAWTVGGVAVKHPGLDADGLRGAHMMVREYGSSCTWEPELVVDVFAQEAREVTFEWTPRGDF